MSLVASIAAAVALDAAAVVQDVALQVEAPRAPTSMEADVGDVRRDRICKQVLRTGSRLGEQRVCKSLDEWEAIRQDARQATERKQIFSYVGRAD